MKALVMIANGIEELETVTTTDILVRAGIEVMLASVNTLEVIAARGLKLSADVLIEDVVDDFDVLVCPGGLEGAENLSSSTYLSDLLLARHREGKTIAAICASPALVLAPLKILHGTAATCYPAFQVHLSQYVNQKVVVSDHLITSQGPATSADFALAIVEHLAGSATAQEVAKQALYA